MEVKKYETPSERAILFLVMATGKPPRSARGGLVDGGFDVPRRNYHIHCNYCGRSEMMEAIKMLRIILKAAACAVCIHFLLGVKCAAEQQDIARAVYCATFAICTLITAFNW